MKDPKQDGKVIAKEEAYRGITSIIFLYTRLSEERQKLFMEALNNNPLGKVIKSSEFSIEKIFNFEAFEDYFIYQPERGDGMILLVNKADISSLLRNIEVSLKNDWKSQKKYLLN